MSAMAKSLSSTCTSKPFWTYVAQDANNISSLLTSTIKPILPISSLQSPL